MKAKRGAPVHASAGGCGSPSFERGGVLKTLFGVSDRVFLRRVAGRRLLRADGSLGTAGGGGARAYAVCKL